MKNLLISLSFFTFILLSVLFQAFTMNSSNHIPKTILNMIDTLEKKESVVKTVYDDQSGRAYWLSFKGNLHTANEKGNAQHRINQGSPLWNDVTFIEDFCLNASYDSLYFTDLMDLQSGMSAIKITDVHGKDIKVIALLQDEIPYHISIDSEKQMLFYLSKALKKGYSSYQLKYIDLRKEQKGILYTSEYRINDINLNSQAREVIIHDNRNRPIAFSTTIQNPNVFAEAFRTE